MRYIKSGDFKRISATIASQHFQNRLVNLHSLNQPVTYKLSSTESSTTPRVRAQVMTADLTITLYSIK